MIYKNYNYNIIIMFILLLKKKNHMPCGKGKNAQAVTML